MNNPEIQVTLKPSKILLLCWCFITLLLLIVVWTIPRAWEDQVVATIALLVLFLWNALSYYQQLKKPIRMAWQDQVFYIQVVKNNGQLEWVEIQPKKIKVKLWLVKFSYKVKSSMFSKNIAILPDQLSEADHRIWRLLLRFNHLNEY